MVREPTLIKRYSTSRLYDVAALRYVTIDDLIEMASKGERFIVRDAKTGQDVTSEWLDRLH